MADYDPDYDVPGNMQRLALVMSALDSVDLAGFLAVAEMAHTLGPFIDPTKYADQLRRGDMDEMAALCRELLPAQRRWREQIAPKIPAAAA